MRWFFIYLILVFTNIYNLYADDRWFISASLNKSFYNKKFSFDNLNNTGNDNIYLKVNKFSSANVGLYYKFTESLNLGLDFGSSFSAKAVGSYSNKDISVNSKFSTTTLMLSGIYNFTDRLLLDNKVTPYVKIGVGLAENKLKSSHQHKILHLTSYYHSKKINNFTYKASLGAKYKYSKKISLFAEASYQDFGKISSSDQVTTNNVVNKSLHNKHKLQNANIALGVQFSF